MYASLSCAHLAEGVHGDHQVGIGRRNGFLEGLEAGAPRDHFLQPGGDGENAVVPEEAPQGRVVLEHPVEGHHLVVGPHAVVRPHVYNLALCTATREAAPPQSQFGLLVLR